jgi:hypothetical protein
VDGLDVRLNPKNILNSLPKEHQRILYNLHAQKLSALAGHEPAKAAIFIEQETNNMMDGHPSGIELTQEEYLEKFPQK